MESFTEIAAFFEKADDTLHDISQQLSHGSDILPRQYISVLKDCLSSIRVLKEEALHAVHSFEDDHGLNHIVSSSNELMQLTYQLKAKTEQYLKRFSAAAASDSVVSETSRNSSMQANGESYRESDGGYHASDDEVVENDTEENCEDAGAASAMENCSVPDHCNSNSAITAASSSPQPPTLADYGITRDTLHRLALLTVQVEPQSSCSADTQCVSEASLLSTGACQKQITTELPSSGVAQSVSNHVYSDMYSIDENIAVSRVPLQPCGNTRCDVDLFSSSPEFPVLSSLAQNCLRSGLKHHK